MRSWGKLLKNQGHGPPPDNETAAPVGAGSGGRNSEVKAPFHTTLKPAAATALRAYVLDRWLHVVEVRS